MLDWPAFGNALWQVNDQLGIRPEWQLPVLNLESGFDPSIVNVGGCVGINQFCPNTYPGYVGVPIDQYRQWAASQQLAGPVLAYWRAALGHGPIRSSIRLMIAQLGQVLLETTPTLDSVVYAAPNSGYFGNARVFDPGYPPGKGYFTVQDVANAMAVQARSPAVQDALARAYAMRPSERMSDAVYGHDYAPANPFARVTPPTQRGGAGSTALAAVGALVLAATAGFVVQQRRAERRRDAPPPEPEPFVYP